MREIKVIKFSDFFNPEDRNKEHKRRFEWRTKISTDLVCSIENDLKNGLTDLEISRKYDVTPYLVNIIKVRMMPDININADDSGELYDTYYER